MGKYAADNFNACCEVMEQDRPAEVEQILVDSIRWACRLDTYDPDVWQEENEGTTVRAKRDWLAILLTGGLLSWAYPEDKNKSAAGDFQAVEFCMPYPMVEWQPLFGACYTSSRPLFSIVREIMRDECPELLTSIAREEYEHVWPGWTEGRDMIHTVMRAKGSFWQPLLSDALETWGGYRASCGFVDSNALVMAFSFQWLLTFGKPGGAGVNLPCLMAQFGKSMPTLPEMVNQEAGPVRDSKGIQRESGSGQGVTECSVNEAASVLYDFTGQQHAGFVAEHPFGSQTRPSREFLVETIQNQVNSKWKSRTVK